ncbi:synaptonemal complex protein 2-like isoform X2 [Toxotes jaculatrix]|uniref:synaptonemal complex protein 2-like isoform X2 n=2 Tax=Toxotes jaculatrix TaxID=941984 RepID=UPI001B3AFFB7|nr:synaptonemal complex protein 2-like isoform X2 [Toxotes jaculatrix]
MFQVQMEDCLLRGDSSHLVSVLHYEGLTSTTLTRLDQLVTKDLCGSGFSRVQVVLKCLETVSEDRGDMQTLMSHGLTAKVLLWFEAVRDLLTSDLHKSSGPLLSLTEEFYDYFLLLGQASLPVSQLSVVLLQLAQLALDPKIHFPLRLEAIRTFNSILESLSREQRRLIQIDQNQNQILSQVAAAVLTVGDYELQVSLSEALCRLTPRKDRQQRANQWFSCCDISNAFCDIRDADFEVDCRRFLNFVNRRHGNQRRVYTFPCIRAFLDSTQVKRFSLYTQTTRHTPTSCFLLLQLFRPKDDKLDEFWIDFNVGSGCVSFFIDEPEGLLWGSIHLLKEEVTHYSFQVKHDGCTAAQTVLTVQLNNPITHHNSRGQTVELSFKCELQMELEEAAGRVFMKMKSSPCCQDTGGTVQPPPSADKHSGRSYSRKKPQSKSQLRILPLSSPSSEDDSSVTKTPGKSRAEFLFDQIRHSTPTYDSGVPVRAEPEVTQGDTDESGGGSSRLQQEAFSSDRKRSAADSGYLSDQTEGTTSHKRKVEPQPEGAECNSAMTERSPEGVGPSTDQEEELSGGGAGPRVKTEEPVKTPETEVESDVTSGIAAAFKTFKTQLEQSFTGCWQKAEQEVLQSLKECQQHTSSLLTAVHQHRLLLLQRFENSVTDQLSRLEENSANLSSVNTQILSFFQSEIQRLASFCDEHLQRLKCLENGVSKNLSNQ